VILESADYLQTTTMEAGAVTLARIRGEFNLRATVLGGFAYVGIYVIGATEGAPLPNAFTSYISGEMLFHDCVMVPVSPQEPYHGIIDIKVKRRLEGDRVVFGISAVAQTVTYTYGLRCLLLGG